MVAHITLLTDRSQSMEESWSEMIGAVNLYGRGAAENVGPDAKIRLSFFDSCGGVATIVKKPTIEAKDWVDLEVSDRDIYPRGATPLYEVITKTMISTLEEHKADEPVILVITTDGEDTSSAASYRPEAVQNLIAKFKERNWLVLFLAKGEGGIFTQHQTLGVTADSALQLNDAGAMGAFESAISLSADYVRTGAARGFSADERAKSYKS